MQQVHNPLLPPSGVYTTCGIHRKSGSLWRCSISWRVKVIVSWCFADNTVHRAAALSQNIGKEPVGVEMLSEKLVLFRNNEGKVVAINDVCPHRGAPLHKGAAAAGLLAPASAVCLTVVVQVS